ncbi:MAG: HAMP domain-containing sensor histidine kinase [Bacteroidota bacterium]
MNTRISAFLSLLSVVLFLLNHYWIEWERYARKRAEQSLNELILAQRQDLESWASGKNSDPLFRKRTLCQGRLTNWSDDRPFEYELSIDSIGLIESENGVFLYQALDEGDCTYYSGYPLYQFFSISNQYLKDQRGAKLTHHIKGASGNGTYPFQNLLAYEIKPEPSPVIDAIIGLLLITIMIAAFVRFAALGVKSFFAATVVLVLVRLLSLSVDAMDVLFRFALFDPIHFTSSFFNPTLGDLFLNMLLIFLLVAYSCKYMSKVTGPYVWLGFLTISFALSLLVFHIPWSILNNSQLSLSVGASIKFTYLRVFAFLSIILLCTAYFLFVYRLQQVLVAAEKLRNALLLTWTLAMALLLVNPYLTLPPLLSTMVFLVAYRSSTPYCLGNFNYKNLLLLLGLSVAVAVLLSFYTYKHGERATLFAKKKFANYLLLKRDVLGEYYLSQGVEKLSSDTAVMMVASEGTREDLEQLILSQFQSPYFNKYAIEIVFQDYQRLRVNSRFTRENGLLTADNAPDYKNIHFVDQGANFKYVAKLSIGDLVALVIFKVKKRVPTTVYPALLTDSKFLSASSNFDYAVFSGPEILFHRSKFGQGEWPQLSDFKKPSLYDKGLEKNGKHYFGVETTDGRTILIISEKYPRRSQLANFSFFFLLLLFAFSAASASTSLYRRKKAALTFTGKIQLYLSMAFIIPLLSAGFALLSTLNSSYKEEINRSYLKQALYISELLSEYLAEVNQEFVNVDELNAISSYAQSDISFYNASGYLRSTSQPEIFSLGLQSNLVNPVVFDELIKKENQSMIADESIGLLDYKVCYAVVNDQYGEVAGFIAMPFFDSRNHLRRQQIDVFDGLIIIFAFIFILVILVGNFVLNNLLYPLRMVAGKIRQITLEEINKPIKYESSDEIGSLVRDYNQMLVKLELSKEALAKSQKETAWKEIAKQVAHEIKNPLTPMQLKIQQLLRKAEPDSKAYESLTSLLTQVDTLSQIAQSFSAFAEMPVPNNQIFAWNELVEEVGSLYSSSEVHVSVKCDKKICIDADQDIFRRILNNIVLNAIQSSDNDPSVKIHLTEKAGKALLSVQDNGRGIPDELSNKIFLNYFSTKAAGSGIGLALAKKGIENAGGNIWFESVVGEGTTFFISMPLAAVG